jgi:hypothetical protein
MLLETRNPDCPYSVPKFNFYQNDIDDFLNELREFHEQFADCFHRFEFIDHFFKYMAGQSSQLDRKSIEPIACAVESGHVKAMQRFVSDPLLGVYLPHR